MQFDESSSIILQLMSGFLAPRRRLHSSMAASGKRASVEIGMEISETTLRSALNIGPVLETTVLASSASAATSGRRNSAKKPYLLGLAHHGNHHGPAPPPPTHISNNPPQNTSSQQQHPMSNLSNSTSGSAAGQVTAQQPSSQSLVSNGGLNGHANMGTQLFGDTEPENEKWWW